MTGFEPAASCSQSRRATNCATPGYVIKFIYPAGRILPNQARYQLRYTRIFNFCHYTTTGGKIKVFSVCGHSCGQSCFLPLSAIGESPANAGVARLCGVSPHPIPDTTTALPKQARYQLRYTPIRYSLCIANPFLTALIVYWILAGKSTGRLHIPPE